MNKTMELFEVYAELVNASEISYATLDNFIDSAEDVEGRYILLGVLQQLGKIKEATDRFNEVMTAKEVA